MIGNAPNTTYLAEGWPDSLTRLFLPRKISDATLFYLFFDRFYTH
jgi:hypothetical protein